MIRRRIVLAILFGALFGAGWWTGHGRAAGSSYGQTDLFLEVLHAVDMNYVDPVNPATLVAGAVRGLLRDLDPHAQLLTREEFAAWEGGAREGGDGVGLSLDVRGGWPTVIAPLEGSAAWEAGLQPGDVITRIGERSLFGESLDEIAARLRGAEGSTVELTLSRAGDADPRQVSLVRRRLTIRSIGDAFLVPSDIGVVRLAAFSSQSGAQLRAKLDSLRRVGARRLVLDLRGNAGGSLERAVEIAGLFLPEGSKVVETRGRDSARSQWHRTSDKRPLLDWPMAVLVDGASASAAEVVAGALQDLDRAVIVGTTSFGRASVQNVFPLRGDQGAIKLTVAVASTPSGRLIQPRPPRPTAAADDDEATEPPRDAAPDSASRPRFHSRSGRTVLGGGGVMPDLVVRADSSAVLRPGTVAERRAALLADPVFRAAAERLRAARGPRDVWAAGLGTR